MLSSRGPLSSAKVLPFGLTVHACAQVALDQLGYSPCFHARFMPYITDLFDTMYDYAEGRRPDFPAKELFRQFNAAVDIPAPLIPLVLEAYPEAKVRPLNQPCVLS